MLVDKKFEKELDCLAEKQLFYVMKNKGLFSDSTHLSTVQYMNAKNCRNQIKFNELLYNKLVQYDKDGVYLDIGLGPAFLELCNSRLGNKLHISTVEWEKQVDQFKVVRDEWNVKVDYLCNDILDDDFKIYNCETFYDYVILQRFFPVYKSDVTERIDDVLRKFVPYAKKAIIVEADNNWSSDQWKHLLAISEKRIKVYGSFNMFSINLEQYK
tara:strand:+ start:2843 stop:3481 length:639 start_codon:yes stop_codon:yes gene_type:complete